MIKIVNNAKKGVTMAIYYNIKDLKLVGKRIDDRESKDYGNYIHVDGEWKDDIDFFITTRLLGVDIFEPSDSPYKIGNSDVIKSIEEINESQLDELIDRYSKLSSKEKKTQKDLIALEREMNLRD